MFADHWAAHWDSPPIGRTSGGGRDSNFFIQTFSTSCCGTVHLDVYNPAIAHYPIIAFACFLSHLARSAIHIIFPYSLPFHSYRQNPRSTTALQPIISSLMVMFCPQKIPCALVPPNPKDETWELPWFVASENKFFGKLHRLGPGGMHPTSSQGRHKGHRLGFKVRIKHGMLQVRIQSPQMPVIFSLSQLENSRDVTGSFKNGILYGLG